jgi:hypothetical protein
MKPSSSNEAAIENVAILREQEMDFSSFSRVIKKVDKIHEGGTDILKFPSQHPLSS